MRKKNSLRPLCLSLLLAAGVAPAFGAQFAYHGELMDGDQPAEGRFDLRLRSLASANAKSALGEAVELAGVEVRDGSFAVEMELPEAPFGDTFVEVAVRRAGTEEKFETLGAPQAIAKANTGCWALDGNAPVPAGSFVGIADPDSAQPLVLKARSAEVARMLPLGTPAAFGDAPAMRFGSPANVADAIGATVGGGGSSRDPIGADCPHCGNAATASFATVGGGHANTASGASATLSGGRLNIAAGTLATLSGGLANTAWGHASAVGGGQFNTAGGDQSFVAAGAANCAGGDQSSRPASARKPATATRAAIFRARASRIRATPTATKAASSGPMGWAATSCRAGRTSSWCGPMAVSASTPRRPMRRWSSPSRATAASTTRRCG